MRILQVEDDAQLGVLVKRAVEGAGYTVDWVTRGDDAVEMATAYDYGIVLPGMSPPGLPHAALSARIIRPILLLALLLPSAVMAQQPANPAPPTSTRADANPSPICTDRPGKNSSACTVPKGSFQLETDLLNWTRSDVDGTRTDTILYTSPYLKYGVTNSTTSRPTSRPWSQSALAMTAE